MLNKLQDVKDPFHFLSLKLKLGLTFTFLWAVPIGYAIIYFKDPMHFLLFVSPLFLISLIFPYWFLIKPLEKIKKGAKMLSMGFLDYRIKNHSNNELGLVSKSFNHMADCIQDRTLALENNSEILKNKTKELNFAKDKFKSILAAMNDGVLYLNLQGEVVHANPGGKLLESILSSKGRRPPNIKHCRQGKIIGEECFTCLKKNNNLEIESCLLEEDDRILEINSSPILDEKKTIKGRVLVSRDITNLFRQQAQISHQNRLLLIGEMAATIAHEVNNPLTAISLYNQMIAEAPNIHQELKENVEVIDRNVKSAKNIIRNFLDFSNLGNRDTEKVFIQDLIFESIEFVTLIAKNKKVVIETSAPSDDYYLVGNEVQIKQVFINILMNAFQAFEKKSRSIKINSFYDDQENELEIRFINNGPKIPKEIQEHIFESFFTTKKRENGTGLGLSTARRILETYKGSILLESSNNQETTFSVRLPALRVQKNFNFEEKKPESDDFQYAE